MSFTVKDVLKLQVAPALGCTEPVAIALGAAAAMSLLPGDDFDSIELALDPNVYKNALAVSIPGTGGHCGLDMAAALGAYGGDPSLRLEVLRPVNGDHVRKSEKAKAEGRIKVTLLGDRHGLYVKNVIARGSDVAESVIEGLHDHIVSLKLNGQPVESPLLAKVCANGESPLAAMEAWLKGLSLPELMALTDGLDEEDLAFLQEGVDTNLRLAEQGLKYGLGLGVGKTLERLARQGLIKRDMMLAARILASGAADARMSGVPLPAMSS
ncbi:MAG: serine dehydratase subunit alpha family protein, partial [Pseudodesulfovibrio sp.]